MDGISEQRSELSRMGDSELLDALREVEAERSRLYARELAVLSELDGRAVGPRLGYSDTAAIARDVLRLNPAQSRRRTRDADAVNGSHTPTGQPLPAQVPSAGQALAEGAIGPDHVQAIGDCVARFPHPADPDDVATADEVLTAAARQHEPTVIARLGRRILAQLDQDGRPPNEDELVQPRRSLDLRTMRDGRLRFTGELDAESAALLHELLSPRTAPRANVDGSPDLRPKTARQGDALVEIFELAAGSPDGPTEAGEPVHMTVSVNWEDLREQHGQALLHGTGEFSVAQARRMACDCRVLPAVLGSNGEVLDIGRKTRTIPQGIRRALIERDAGCTFPGCHRHPKWCHGHHVTHWADGGDTALHNLALLCHYHHRVIHHTGWNVHMRHGKPEFTPPAHVDPQRKPMRNIPARERLVGSAGCPEDTGASDGGTMARLAVVGTRSAVGSGHG